MSGYISWRHEWYWRTCGNRRPPRITEFAVRGVYYADPSQCGRFLRGLIRTANPTLLDETSFAPYSVIVEAVFNGRIPPQSLSSGSSALLERACMGLVSLVVVEVSFEHVGMVLDDEDVLGVLFFGRLGVIEGPRDDR